MPTRTSSHEPTGRAPHRGSGIRRFQTSVPARYTCNGYAIIRFMNEYLDYNINSGCFNDVYNAFKTQSELIFLPFAANWGCKPAHGSVGGTAMTKSVRKYLYWVDYYMCTNFQRVLICFGGLGEPWKVAVAWGSGHNRRLRGGVRARVPAVAARLHAPANI